MEYIHGLSTQGKMFLFSLGFGFILGVIYDAFRLLRILAGKKRGVTVFADLLYCALATVLTFFFLLVLDGGKIRLYSVGGEITGFAVYIISFGAVSGRLFEAIKRALDTVFRPILSLFGKWFAFLKKNSKKFEKKQNISCKTHIL